ncbi:MAG: hypothetical protein NO483_06405 [Candidatus Methanomethylicia archaeon]|jgi:hypothetical protein|nr:hypothetical protein [Candidatus Methanomethylicia archaeon]
MSDKNLSFGLFLAIFGVFFSIGSYFILMNIPLTALGIGISILGIAWAMIPSNPIPRKSTASLIKSSCSNIEVLLEALGLFERAIYIPINGKIIAYIPIKKSEEITLSEIKESTSKFIFKNGKNLGVIIIPPWISNPISNPIPETNLDGILEYALLDSEIASSVTVVKNEDNIVIEIKGLKIDIDYSRFKIVMGSLPACIAAQAIALALSRPIKIISERKENNKLIVQLRILNWTDRKFT